MKSNGELSWNISHALLQQIRLQPYLTLLVLLTCLLLVLLTSATQ
jgi:hypothetical protein